MISPAVLHRLVLRRGVRVGRPLVTEPGYRPLAIEHGPCPQPRQSRLREEPPGDAPRVRGLISDCPSRSGGPLGRQVAARRGSLPAERPRPAPAGRGKCRHGRTAAGRPADAKRRGLGGESGTPAAARGQVSTPSPRSAHPHAPTPAPSRRSAERRGDRDVRVARSRDGVRWPGSASDRGPSARCGGRMPGHDGQRERATGHDNLQDDKDPGRSGHGTVVLPASLAPRKRPETAVMLRRLAGMTRSAAAGRRGRSAEPARPAIISQPPRPPRSGKSEIPRKPTVSISRDLRNSSVVPDAAGRRGVGPVRGRRYPGDRG